MSRELVEQSSSSERLERPEPVEPPAAEVQSAGADSSESKDLASSLENWSDESGSSPSEVPSVAERAERWTYQGDNERQWENTCSQTSGAQILSELSGQEVTENDVVEKACEIEACDDDGWVNDVEDISRVHEAMGMESSPDNGLTVGHLAAEVETPGNGVMALVNSAELNKSEGAVNSEIAEFEQMSGPDHAVWVTGVERASDGSVEGFYVNDPAHWQGAPRYVPVEQMRNSWESHDGWVVVTRNKEGGQ